MTAKLKGKPKDSVGQGCVGGASSSVGLMDIHYVLALGKFHIVQVGLEREIQR